MSEFLNNPLAVLTCTLGIAGWIVTVVGLCTSYAYTHALSWWVISYELVVVLLACIVFWTDTVKVYYPVVLTLIAISFPYSTAEIAVYITAGKASLSAAASGYIMLMATQFIWIFLLGIQNEDSVLRSFHDLNGYHNRVYSSSNYHQKDRLSVNSSMFAHNNAMDVSVPNYPVPLPTQVGYAASINHDRMSSVPVYISPSQNTVFLSPHTDYLIPVTAIHSYSANKEDPNEISFNKGEVLHVHEKKGSWWQAKKSNGAIGMIPSNYVTEQTSK